MKGDVDEVKSAYETKLKEKMKEIARKGQQLDGLRDNVKKEIGSIRGLLLEMSDPNFSLESLPSNAEWNKEKDSKQLVMDVKGRDWNKSSQMKPQSSRDTRDK